MLTPVPPTACQRAREAVSIQLDGELSELGSARLAAHLRECEACAAYALEVAATTTRLRSAPLEQPNIEVDLPSRRRRVAVPLAVAAAALAAGVVAVGQALTSGGPPASPTSAGVRNLAVLRAEVSDQHLLAMLRKLPPADEVRLGRIVLL